MWVAKIRRFSVVLNIITKIHIELTLILNNFSTTAWATTGAGAASERAGNGSSETKWLINFIERRRRLPTENPSKAKARCHDSQTSWIIARVVFRLARQLKTSDQDTRTARERICWGKTENPGICCIWWVSKRTKVSRHHLRRDASTDVIIISSLHFSKQLVNTKISPSSSSNYLPINNQSQQVRSPENVIRLPKGPTPGQGFNIRR